MIPAEFHRLLSEPAATRTPTHCVFRRNGSWLALPATSIREALPRPAIVTVPGTPASFIGLCHIRSEFIPVLNPDSVLTVSRMRDSAEILLVIDDADGIWALLVDEVSSLRTLEMSDAPEAANDSWCSAVVGWATAGERVIQVLDPCRLRELTARDLSDYWESFALTRSSEPRAASGVSETVSAT